MASTRSTSSSSPKRNSGGSSRSGSARPPRAKRAPSRPRSTSDSTAVASRSTDSRKRSGVLGTLKTGAGKAKGPAVAAGAAAAGIAGAVALRNRRSRRKVLGVPVPRIDKAASDMDVKSLMKTVGEASKRFGKTAKSVSKDIERVGDQAERIGKILA